MNICVLCLYDLAQVGEDEWTPCRACVKRMRKAMAEEYPIDTE